MTCIHIQNGKPTGDHRVYFGTKRAGVRTVIMYDSEHKPGPNLAPIWLALVRRKVVGSVMEPHCFPPSGRRVPYW